MLLEGLPSFSEVTVAEALGVEVEREDLEGTEERHLALLDKVTQQFRAHERCICETGTCLDSKSRVL